MFAKPTETIAETTIGKLLAFHFVSVASVLKLLLSNEDMCCHILSHLETSSGANHMTSFFDTSAFEENVFFPRILMRCGCTFI
jgi:hypothetical protein